MSTGIYHKRNILKLRVMNALFIHGCTNTQNRTMTCKEIAANLGDVPPNHVSRMMSNLHEKKAGYFARMKPAKGSREYRYKLTRKGLEWYTKYMQRILKGLDLNFSRDIPVRVRVGVREIEKEMLMNAMDSKLDDDLLNDYLGFTREGYEELKAN